MTHVAKLKRARLLFPPPPLLQDADSLMYECGGVLLNSVVALLQQNTANQISEQVRTCVCVSLSIDVSTTTVYM